MSKIAIIQAFQGMPDYRDNQGKRHSLSLCLALFTLSVTAGNQGFLAMGDWLKYHAEELKGLFEVSIMALSSDQFPQWQNAATVIKVERERKLRYKVERETCYYLSDLSESAVQFAHRIRIYWGVENRVHYVRDVTFGEDHSRTRTGVLPSFSGLSLLFDKKAMRPRAVLRRKGTRIKTGNFGANIFYYLFPYYFFNIF